MENLIKSIISCLWPYCERHTGYLCKLEENEILLKTAINELKEARDDVQRRVVEEEADPNEANKCTEQVRGWLQRVHNIEGEVEVILKKVDEQLSRATCLGGFCPPNNCWSNYKVGKSIAEKILPLVVELKGKGKFQVVTNRLPPPLVQPMNLESTVGMESMFDKVWRLINSTDYMPVKIMGLYGTGGVGKTTLLEKINNEFNKISEHDHVVIFVVVSKPINVQAIQTQIGERLRLPLQGDERKRANRIFNMLSNKKFVILLDDLWGRINLRHIGIPNPLKQRNSSKVIFTTRSQKVCGFMEATHKFQVECLPWDKAWSLFQHKVGEKALNCISEGGARELAKDVAKECGGLPLALITIGRAMSTKKSVEEWRDAIKTLRSSASKFEGMSDEVLPRLKLSYDNLSDETEKSCFCYCSLYPEDHSIKIAELVELWIAEGFLDGFYNNLDEARDRGHTIIGSLKSACLLESSGEDDDVKMHDVIRDLALWIVNDCKSNSSTTDKFCTTDKFLLASNVCQRWRNAERIFWNWNWNTPMQNTDLELEEPPTFRNLRTLLLRGFAYPNFSLPQNFFQFMPFLRVLDISDIQLTELPTSICQLSDLQYLNLSSTEIKELPNELRNLVKLKALNLSCTEHLKKIPLGVIANFSKLQVLKLVYSGFKFKDLGGFKEENGGRGLSLRELNGLKQLQEITLNISTSLALEELLRNQKLRRICTALVLESCVNLKSISLLPPSSTTTTSSKRGLGNLISLKDVSFNSCVELEELVLFINDEGGGETNTPSTTATTSAAAGLPRSNNNKLQRLYLKNLPRLNNIVWGEKQQHYYLHYASSFQNLYSINIDSCNALKDLTWVVYVESLKYLTIEDCSGLETIIELGDDDDDGLEEIVVFRRLKILKMFGLRNLKSICSHALVFPSIQTIHVSECPVLNKLPLDSRSNINNTLRVIKGESKWWSELQWGEEDVKFKFLPYFRKRFRR